MEISLQAVKATVEKGLTALAPKEATRREQIKLSLDVCLCNLSQRAIYGALVLLASLE